MGIDFNYKNVKDADTVMFEDRVESGVAGSYVKRSTEALIFDLALCVGISAITPKTIDEIEVRLRALFLGGFTCYAVVNPQTKKSEPRAYSREMLEAHMGLTTNGSPKTRAQFVKYLGERLLDQAERAVRNEREKKAVPA